MWLSPPVIRNTSPVAGAEGATPDGTLIEAYAAVEGARICLPVVKVLPPARLALSASCPSARVVSVEMAVLAAVIEADRVDSAPVARVTSAEIAPVRTDSAPVA